MATVPSDHGYSALALRLFAAKEEWHEARARLSFSEKLRVLDRLRANAGFLPKLVCDRPSRSDA